MTWPGELLRRLKMLLHRRQFDATLEEEMRLHLELRQEQLIEVRHDRRRRAASLPEESSATQHCSGRRAT